MAQSLEQLEQRIIDHRRTYYVGQPSISDHDYDQLEDQLRALDPNHPLLQKVGSDSLEAKVPHASPMLSLQKTYSIQELESWRKQQPVVGMLKIDGNSLSLIYRQGRLVLAKTRGNGQLGENVTAKIIHVPSIPIQIAEFTDDEIRGELYCSLSNFLALAEEMQSLNLAKPTSPRNVVAGLLGRKEHQHLARYFDFIAYDLLRPNLDSEMAKLQLLNRHGFMLPDPQLLEDTTSVRVFLDRVEQRLADEEIAIDGAVFVLESLEQCRVLGNTTHHPRYKMSFKWQGETALSTIVAINWHTSRLGFVTPVAEIEPVNLSKATIKRVTLHNSSYVTLYNLKIGDQIEIVRSGEVIPKFLRVVKSGAGSNQLPQHCARCSSTLIDDGVRLICPDKTHCPAQILLMILNWIKCADIRDLSEKRLTLLVEMQLVQSIPDLYRLTIDDLLRVPATKERLAEKLYQNITNSKKISTEQLLSGLGIRGAGRATWRALLKKAGNLENIFAMSADDIATVEGFAEKSAQQIANGLKANKELVDELFNCGVQIIDRTTNSKLSGQRFVISGALSQPRSYYQKLIEDHGGVLGSSVSKTIRAVITNDQQATSIKIKQAKKLAVPLLDEQQFLALLED